MARQDRFFDAVIARRLVRPSVRAIVYAGGRFLVQRPTDDPGACYAFIGGEYEHGDSFDNRIRREFEEETSARVIAVAYAFVVENRFRARGGIVHGLEHYLRVELDRDEVVSRERHLAQHWLTAAEFATADVRPRAVRDLLTAGSWDDVRHLAIEP